MEPHSHMSPTLALWIVLIVVAIFGTAHLLSLTYDNRLSRTWLALGF